VFGSVKVVHDLIVRHEQLDFKPAQFKWTGNDFGVIEIFLVVISSDADKLRHYGCVGLQESF